jgi:hypothetical protein
LIVLLIACCAAVVLWSRGSDEAAPPDSATPATPDTSARIAGSTPIGRERPAVVVPESAPPTVEGAFAGEPVDRDFAGRKTALVRTTVEGAIADAGAFGVHLDRVECRSQRCQLTLEGPGLMEVLARLEDERGFYGKARELALHDLVNGNDGQPHQVTMTLTFGPADL